ncbi:MAG: hypothetical protein KAR38_07005 [Calditrichia bacterium]|nr:hypothetical protein [Calditrichia bacterium]
MRKKSLFLLVLIILLSAGCSINKIAVRKTAELVGTGMSAIYEESDLELAEISIASNLKLLEVLLKSDPGNKNIKVLLAQGYGSYALGFIEDEDPERAKYFYLKARDYAVEVLNAQLKVENITKLSLDELKTQLAKLNINHVEPLFWAATFWGSWAMLSLDNNRALFALPKIEAMMQRILELDERFYFAGAHLFFGSLYAAKPVMLGGKPDKSKEHFEKALKLTDNKFLITKVFYARFYAVQVQEAELYEKLLQEVLDADLEILPEYRLINKIAKQKAQLWLNKKNDLF